MTAMPVAGRVSSPATTASGTPNASSDTSGAVDNSTFLGELIAALAGAAVPPPVLPAPADSPPLPSVGAGNSTAAAAAASAQAVLPALATPVPPAGEAGGSPGLPQPVAGPAQTPPPVVPPAPLASPAPTPDRATDHPSAPAETAPASDAGPSQPAAGADLPTAVPATPTPVQPDGPTVVQPVQATVPPTVQAAPQVTVQPAVHHQEPASTTAVIRQVFPEVTRLAAAGPGTHRVALTLHPESLGEVRVVLTVRNDTVRVTLAADHARNQLVEGAPELHRLLELAGSTDTRIVVRDLSPATSTPIPAPEPTPSTSTTTTTTTGGFDRSGGRQPTPSYDGRDRPMSAQSPAQSTDPEPAVRPRPSAGLDRLI